MTHLQFDKNKPIQLLVTLHMKGRFLKFCQFKYNKIKLNFIVIDYYPLRFPLKVNKIFHSHNRYKKNRYKGGKLL